MECFYPNIIVTLLRFMFSSVPTCFEDVKLLRGMDGLLNGHRCRGSSSPYEVLMCQSHVDSRPNRSLTQPFFRVFKFIFDMVAFERVAQSRRKRIPAKQQRDAIGSVLCLFQSCMGGLLNVRCSGAHLLIKCTC